MGQDRTGLIESIKGLNLSTMASTRDTEMYPVLYVRYDPWNGAMCTAVGDCTVL